MDLIITGFAIVTFDKVRKRYVIEKMFVDPKYQQQGVAQSLIHTIISNFKDYPITTIIFKENRIAAHILIKYNFKQTYNRNINLEYGTNTLPIPQTYYLLERIENEGDLL